MRATTTLLNAMKGDAVTDGKTMTVLDYLSSDAQIRLLYEARQKGIRDYNSAISRATEEGLT